MSKEVSGNINNVKPIIIEKHSKDKPYLELKEEKKNGIEKWLIEQGIELKGVYGSAVGSKTEEEIKKQINDHLKSTELLGEKI